MNLSCLNIRQEYAKIDIKSQPAKLDMSTKPAKLDINTQPAVLDINKEQGTLQIDNYPCRRALGFKNNADFIGDAAQEGMQALRDFTARIVSNTNQFSQTPAKASAAVANNSASNNRGFREQPRVTIKYIDLPKYNYTPDKVNISYQRSKVNINVTPSPVENNSQVGSVDISMAQNPSIRMWVSEGKFDVYG